MSVKTQVTMFLKTSFRILLKPRVTMLLSVFYNVIQDKCRKVIKKYGNNFIKNAVPMLLRSHWCQNVIGSKCQILFSETCTRRGCVQ